MSIDASHYEARETLRNGTPVTIRAVRPDDRQRIREAFANLEPESIYTRLFRFKSELTEEDLDQLTRVDFDRHVGLLATVERDGQEIAIGSASCIVLDPRGTAATRAEVAFTIEEDYQGQGLASKLLQHLIRIAGDRGLQWLEAEVLAENGAMLKVFERCGLPLKRRREGGVIHVEMTLGTPQA